MGFSNTQRPNPENAKKLAKETAELIASTYKCSASESPQGWVLLRSGALFGILLIANQSSSISQYEAAGSVPMPSHRYNAVRQRCTELGTSGFLAVNFFNDGRILVWQISGSPVQSGDFIKLPIHAAKRLSITNANDYKERVARIKQCLSISTIWQRAGLPGEPWRRKVLSPFRPERSPSFSVFKSGTRWKDWGSGESGDVIDFFRLIYGVENFEAVNELTLIMDGIPPEDRKVITVISEPEVAEPFTDEQNQWRLMCWDRYSNIGIDLPSGVAAELAERKLWTREAFRTLLQERVIGITEEGHLAYLFPHGSKIRPEASTSHRDFWQHGKARFNVWRGEFLMHSHKDTIFICEGETDVLSLLSNRPEQFNELTLGAPGASWNPTPDLIHYIGTGRRVISLADNDRAGEAANERWGKLFASHAKGCEFKTFRWDIAPDVSDIGELHIKSPATLSEIIDGLAQKI